MHYIRSATVALILCFTYAGSAKACDEHERDMAAAYAARDAAAAARIVKVAIDAAACRGNALSLLGRNAALTALAAVATDTGVSDEDRRGRLTQALALGRPWQLLATLGDLEVARKSFGDAAVHFQAALDDIRDETFNPTPPPLDVIKSIFKKAETARLLSSSYVHSIGRSGRTTGLACTRFRDFSVERVALPIEFKYNTTTFTEKGLTAAEDLHKALAEQGQPAVTLVGHTDPIGGEAFNQKLSEERAIAVKHYLSERGYTASKIITAGRGKSQPFVAGGTINLTAAEQHQLDRRVELERTSGAACGS